MTGNSSGHPSAAASIGRGILQAIVLNCILAAIVAFVCAVLMRLLPGLDLLWLPLTAIIYTGVVLMVSRIFYRKNASSSLEATTSFVTMNWIGGIIGGLLALFLLLVLNSFFDTLGIPWLGE